MNPWGVLAIVAGILLIIVGVKGTQQNIANTIAGNYTGTNQPSNAPIGGGGTYTTSAPTSAPKAQKATTPKASPT